MRTRFKKASQPCICSWKLIILTKTGLVGVFPSQSHRSFAKRGLRSALQYNQKFVPPRRRPAYRTPWRVPAEDTSQDARSNQGKRETRATFRRRRSRVGGATTERLAAASAIPTYPFPLPSAACGGGREREGGGFFEPCLAWQSPFRRHWVGGEALDCPSPRRRADQWLPAASARGLELWPSAARRCHVEPISRFNRGRRSTTARAHEPIPAALRGPRARRHERLG